jgi:cytoskeleton protein RodZ
VGEFGDKFRKERERKGISLEEISSVTKISTRMLRAIEDEQFDRLPGGVFNKGFVRAYAKQLGLDEEQAVSEYVACLRQAQLHSLELWEAQTRLGAPSGPAAKSPDGDEELPELQLPRAEHVSPPRRDYAVRREHPVPWRILALAVLVVVLAFLVWRRPSRSSHTPAANSAPPAVASTPQPAAPPASPSALASTTSSSQTPLSAAARTPTSSSPSPSRTVNSPRLPATAHRPVAAAAPPATTGATTPGEAKVQEENVSAAAPIAPDSAESPAASVPALTLVIRASENSWISASADGRPVIHELLIAPAHADIRAAREIVVRVGNAAGVTFLWNGHEVPAQGAEAEVKTLVFDGSGMRALPAAQSPAQNR